jgi:hypothetical protein
MPRLDDLELATLGYLDWFNHVRITRSPAPWIVSPRSTLP